MKKYLLLLIMLLLLVGCNEPKLDEDGLEISDIKITCYADNLGDADVKIDSTVIGYFDDNQQLIGYKIVKTEKIKDRKNYEFRKANYEANKDENQKLTFDDKKHFIKQVIVNQNDNQSAKSFFEEYEKSYKCQIDGIKKSELK